MPSVTLVEISLSTFRLPFLEMWLMLLATSKCLQMYRNDFQYHVNDIICSEHPPSSDCFDEKHTPSSSSPPLSLPLPLPIKKQTESQINPLQFLSSAAIHILHCARMGKSLELFTPSLLNYPPPPPLRNRSRPYSTPSTKTPHMHDSHLHPLHPLSSSSPLQNEMPASDRLSQFADPCGTLPFRPGHCASRSLAKRRGIIFIPQTRGYAPMISNACLAHYQG